MIFSENRFTFRANEALSGPDHALEPRVDNTKRGSLTSCGPPGEGYQQGTSGRPPGMPARFRGARWRRRCVDAGRQGSEPDSSPKFPAARWAEGRL
jgi:hypothetical protein